MTSAMLGSLMPVVGVDDFGVERNALRVIQEPELRRSQAAE
jgi:hypothetical protein